MQVELDPEYEQLMRDAIAAGEAESPQSFVQSLMDSYAADRWIAANRDGIDELLMDRLRQTAAPPSSDWKQRIHRLAIQRLQGQG